jgi:Spy/CpxP family protein refolding chaperone
MFLRTKLNLTGLAATLLIAFGAVAQAQVPQPSSQNQTPGTRAGRSPGRKQGHGFHRRPGPGGNFGPRMLRELGLSDDQKTQVRGIMEQSMAGNKTVREELRLLGEKRRQGTLTDNDQARARLLRQQMRAAMGDTQTRLASVLTPEQKTKAESLINERKANSEGFGGKPRRGLRRQPGPGNTPSQKPANP